jgi:hemerythrin superfamily protein
MCSYCGCQALPVIRLLTVQHELAINKFGEVRRASEAGAVEQCQKFARDLANLLAVHNKLEEEGLFNALESDQDFGETLAKSRLEHDEIDQIVARIISGEIDLVMQLERLLRDNISNEENGLFPASAVTLDGGAWDRIEAQQGVIR